MCCWPSEKLNSRTPSTLVNGEDLTASESTDGWPEIEDEKYSFARFDKRSSRHPCELCVVCAPDGRVPPQCSETRTRTRRQRTDAVSTTCHYFSRQMGGVGEGEGRREKTTASESTCADGSRKSAEYVSRLGIRSQCGAFHGTRPRCRKGSARCRMIFGLLTDNTYFVGRQGPRHHCVMEVLLRKGEGTITLRVCVSKRFPDGWFDTARQQRQGVCWTDDSSISRTKVDRRYRYPTPPGRPQYG